MFKVVKLRYRGKLERFRKTLGHFLRIVGRFSEYIGKKWSFLAQIDFIFVKELGICAKNWVFLMN